jgi:hypothetical protein
VLPQLFIIIIFVPTDTTAVLRKKSHFIGYRIRSLENSYQSIDDILKQSTYSETFIGT